MTTRDIARMHNQRRQMRVMRRTCSARRVVGVALSDDALNRPVSRNSDSFGYNARGEVVFSRRDAENAEEICSYDDIGNLVSNSFGAITNIYFSNSRNQYTSNLCDSASLREEFLPQFDDDGNQTLVKTATGVWQVQYNGE